jgi:prepilin peptidase CpaA
MGAGDVKALGALGAILGPQQVFHVFVYMGLYGGILAILHYLFAHNLKNMVSFWADSFKATVLTKDPRMLVPTRTESLRFPYAAAIAFGYYTYLTLGSVLNIFLAN